jgi:hypothetical protein
MEKSCKTSTLTFYTNKNVKQVILTLKVLSRFGAVNN